MTELSRRNFFGLFAGAAATAIVVPELELLLPKRTIFLPPAGGWHGNSLLTVKLIAEEAMRVLSQDMEFTALLSREYAVEFRQRDLFAQRDGSVTIRRPPRYDIKVGDKITIEGVTWPS